SRGTNGVVMITTKRGRSGDVQINYSFLYSLQDKPEPLPVMNMRQYATMVNEINQITGGESPAAFLDPTLLGEGTDWQKALFKTVGLNNHTFSLSRGNDRTTFYMSGEYYDLDVVVLRSGFQQYSLRLNLDNQTQKWLKISVNIQVSKTDE